MLRTHGKPFEAFLGAVVLVAATVFVLFTYNRVTPAARRSTYALSALFQSVEGLENDAPVHMSGVRVGTIRSINLRSDNFMAEVHFDVQDSLSLPTDSTAMVASRSLLGGKILLLKPGISAQAMPAGHVIERTESPISLETIVSNFIFGGKTGEGNETPRAKTDVAAAESPAASQESAPQPTTGW